MHAVQIVYESTPKSDSGLRGVVVETINQHRHLMLANRFVVFLMEDTFRKNLAHGLDLLTLVVLTALQSSSLGARPPCALAVLTALQFSWAPHP